MVSLAVSAVSSVGCGSDAVTVQEKTVQTASCSACTSGGAAYTLAQCEGFGSSAGCEVSTTSTSAAAGCAPGCSFVRCEFAPGCGGPADVADSTAGGTGGGDIGGGGGPGVGGTDGGSAGGVSAATCAAVGADGYFPDCSACPDTCGDVTVGGVRRYFCTCPGECPCGFTCGAVELLAGAMTNGCVRP